MYSIKREEIQFINNLYISQGTNCLVKSNIFSGCSSSFLTIYKLKLFETKPALLLAA